MLPAASQATSVGWLKLSPGVPRPGTPPPRPPPPPPPPRAPPPPAAAPAARATAHASGGPRTPTPPPPPPPPPRTRGPGSAGTWSTGTAATAAATATRAAAEFADRLRPAAQGPEDAAGGVELGDHPGGAVHHPEVVLGIDSDALRKQERVGTSGRATADLAQKFSALVEFQ